MCDRIELVRPTTYVYYPYRHRSRLAETGASEAMTLPDQIAASNGTEIVEGQIKLSLERGKFVKFEPEAAAGYTAQRAIVDLIGTAQKKPRSYLDFRPCYRTAVDHLHLSDPMKLRPNPLKNIAQFRENQTQVRMESIRVQVRSRQFADQAFCG